MNIVETFKAKDANMVSTADSPTRTKQGGIPYNTSIKTRMAMNITGNENRKNKGKNTI